MMDRVLVQFEGDGFEGDGSGVGDLSWGQRGLWQVMAGKGTWLPIGAVQPVPAGTTVEDAVADLRFVMSQYPSMRTRLRFDSDRSGQPGRPKQVVWTSGEVELEIVDADGDADPAEVAEQVAKRFRTTDYDFVDQWPVRMAVVRHRGALTHRVWIMCHLVTDGTGAKVILAELAARDTSGSRVAMAPLAQARWQGSPAGQQQCRASLRYWERILRRIPARRFPARGQRPHPRYWQARFESPAMHLAARIIAARTGVESPSVLLALFAVALTRVTGHHPVVVQMLVGNRFRRGLARTVSPVMQNGLLAIDVQDSTIDEVVALTRRRALAAYKYAYYDPYQLDELVARIGRERGEEVDIDCYFNDRRLGVGVETGPVPTRQEVRAALPHSTFTWQYQQDYQQFDHLFINVDDEPDTVAMTVLTDIHWVSPADVEACVRGMEEVAVAAAGDPATRAHTTPAAP